MFLTKDNLKQGKNHVSVQLIFQILVTGFLFLMIPFVVMFSGEMLFINLEAFEFHGIL